MSQQLEYLENAYNRVKELQSMNANFHAAATASSGMIRELEIQDALLLSQRIDQCLARELEEIGETYERTKAELEATNPIPSETSEDSFDSFIARCLSDIEDRDDLVADGSAVTVSFSKEGPGGERFFSVTVRNGSVDAETRETTA